jgi:LacI family transcriptional regulator
LPERWAVRPRDEILRVRLNHAKQLLAQTDFSLAMVARKLVLSTPEYLSVIFKKKTGLTPGQFRAQSRITEAADRLAECDHKVV